MGSKLYQKDDFHSEIAIYNSALSAWELCERLGLQIENGKILCPFHDEDNPSVQLYDHHGYCFGCGSYISPIRLVMAAEDTDFYKAIRWIAKEAGLPAPSLNGDSESRYQDVERISNFYQQVFKDSLEHPEKAIEYLEGRGLDSRSLQGIVGYLPYSYKVKNKEEAAKAGLISRNGNFLFAGDHAPKIKFLPETDKRDPYPMSFDEQFKLFQQLPPYLAKMAVFKVNTGCREAEVCGLKWEWEVEVPELGASVFIIPASKVKNRKDRVVILNRVARAVVQEMRGVHEDYVFTYKGRKVAKIYRRAWRDARERVGLQQVRVHDLKHTFGRRLRAAGVSFEDRQDLLGHKSGRITTHYSQAELENLINAVNKVCSEGSRKSPALVVLKKTNRREPSTQIGGISK